MKKFLTVLLALSVVFTYSFSSVGAAFAAETSAEAEALAYVAGVEDSAKELVSRNGDVKIGVQGWTVSAENWELAYEDAYDALVDAVTADTITATTAIDILNVATSLTLASDATDREIQIALEDYLVEQTYEKENATAAVEAQLAEEKAAQLEKVNAVDTSIYSTKEYTEETAPAGYEWQKFSYADGAWEKEKNYVAKDNADSLLIGVKAGIEELTAVEYAEKGEAATNAIIKQHKALIDFVGKQITLVGDEDKDNVEDANETWTYVLTGKFLTIAEENAGDAESDASIAAKKATIASNIASFKAQKQYLTASVDARAAFDEYLEAYETAETYLVENKPGWGVSDTVSITDTAAQKKLVSIVDKADEYIEAAVDAKLVTNKDGSITYDAEVIDANLKAILLDLYENGTTSKELLTGAVINYLTAAEKTAYKAAKEAALTTLEEAEKYYDLEWTAVKAAADAYYAAVDAATVSKDITDAETAYKKAIEKIDTAKDVLDLYKKGTVNTAAKAEFNNLNAYAESLASDQGTKDPLVFDITDIRGTMLTSGADGTLVKFYIDNNARTADEVKALNTAVRAILEAAKSESEIEEEVEAVKDMIDALPAEKSIVSSDKAAVKAAYDAYEALNEGFKKYVSNTADLNKAINAVAKAEKDDILKAVKDLPALSKVTVADKAAVKAVADMIDAYNETEMYDLAKDYVNTSAKNLLTEIRSQEFDAIKEAVKAMPAPEKMTAADKAAVETARALYDAYLADYSDALNTEVTSLAEMENKIIAAEKALAIKLAEEKDKIIAEVKGLKITASSKAAKGSMTINWKVKGDASYADGFRVYKSKKMNSGFGKTYYFQTKDNTKRSYKNTKELKKGTRYYYKVRAYVVIDGKTYFSDYSNKAYRIAK